MGEVKWTNEQMQAINEKGQNILVAAAAGSGKTAVLVERIIQKIIKENVDIDKLLVVTFTSAAASEIRERVLDAIYKKLEETPKNEHLHKQTILLNRANISTIHSFCLQVIRNNFFEIGISPDFRIGDNAEIELLKLDALEETLEQLYEEENQEFLRLTEIYTGYKGDEPLKELIIRIYQTIQSMPFPEKWLTEQIEKFNLKNENKDFAKTDWGKILLQNLNENLQKYIENLHKLRNDLEKEPELDKYIRVIEDDIAQYQNLQSKITSWDLAYDISNTMSFKNWPSDKKIKSDLKEKAKEIRTKTKDDFKKIKEKILIYQSSQAIEDIYSIYEIFVMLKNVIFKFTQKYTEKKLAKNVIDFNDIEHYALKILVTENEEGEHLPTRVAQEYQKKFEEIAIDEYQDSNLVQETILSSISNGKNLFMVGDVKQSIYKFRQARPDLFMDKYEKYKLKEDQRQGEEIKIQLFNNFRSRENVLDFANTIFANIMTKKLGEIDYTKNEYLNYKADYQKPKNSINYAGKMQLEIISADENQEDEDIEKIENTILEARFVANKIKELLKSNYNVWDKKQEKYREITYKDIVILLRAPNGIAPIYEKELNDLDLPVFSDISAKYLESVEIETMMSLLRIIDNPLQDIALVTVLRSYIGGFTDNELIEIRLVDRNANFYETMQKAIGIVNEELKNKIESFIAKIKKWRLEQENIQLDELIWKIYNETGYLNYVSLMPNGGLRQANLIRLFEQAKQYEEASFKGLFNFIKFIDKLKKNSGDLSSAKLIGENENVIRIMSIHKSKGLEFPVVFLSGMGKQFNMQELNDDILIHQQLGLGPKYCNFERRIEYSTLAKEALRIQMENDNLSEEMRVLYVALTRAKEKLIMTGISKKQLETQETNEMVLKKCKSYLQWIQLVCQNKQEEFEKILQINYHSKVELEKQYQTKQTEETENKIEYKPEDKEKMQVLDKLLNWQYKYVEQTKIPSKASVSNIIKNEQIINTVTLERPKFLLGKEKLTKAEIGTVVHLIFQKLDFTKDYTLETLQDLINELVTKEIITKLQADSVNINTILTFTKTKFAYRIKNAEKLEKEVAFYTYIPAKEIYENDVETPILVQGIIDLYFVENGNIVLVDYKTDYISNEQQFIDKHKHQLKMYKMALEKSLKQKVSEVYLYSTTLNKELKVE